MGTLFVFTKKSKQVSIQFLKNTYKTLAVPHFLLVYTHSLLRKCKRCTHIESINKSLSKNCKCRIKCITRTRTRIHPQAHTHTHTWMWCVGVSQRINKYGKRAKRERDEH